jgi:hypothetical protein
MVSGEFWFFDVSSYTIIESLNKNVINLYSNDFTCLLNRKCRLMDIYFYIGWKPSKYATPLVIETDYYIVMILLA